MKKTIMEKIKNSSQENIINLLSEKHTNIDDMDWNEILLYASNHMNMTVEDLLEKIDNNIETHRYDTKQTMDNRMTVQNELQEKRKEMIGHTYRHFKGNNYIVKSLGVHSETEKPMVIYTNSSDETLVWIRDLDMFLSEVDHVKYPNVTQKYRFEKID